ncbi:hypothetical protein FOCC_FOCC009621 [Frankliniella occidentalis]|nr:hypothetical protein FOCC_FOCC016553 [Frankliniella occidentalis]KAE8743746.1 hypothetical protein FOCC_FOCC009621 [Frankliniella occidentalis]
MDFRARQATAQTVPGLRRTTNQDSQDVLMAWMMQKRYRRWAEKDQPKQAQTMQRISDAKFPPAPASAGQTVVVPVPKADRGRRDPRTATTVVLEATSQGFYK